MIELDHVTKRFPDGTVAVDDLSLTVPTGTVLALLGSSGSGKTTTLRMINRLIDPTAGQIRIDGTDIATGDVHRLRRGIGYVIQQSGLFPHRTVVDNIATVPRLLGWDRRRIRQRAMELLELVGLEPALAKRYPAQLSGGQQQRVGVARALAADPPVLLMDEPFGAVDPIVRSQLQAEFVRMQGELRKTTVFVTHDVDEAIAVADRVAVLADGGRLAQLDTPSQLLAHPADEFVARFVGDNRMVRHLGLQRAGDLRQRPLDSVINGYRLVDGRWDGDGGGFPTTTVAAGASAAEVLDAALASPAGGVVLVDDSGQARSIITLDDLRAAPGDPP